MMLGLSIDLKNQHFVFWLSLSGNSYVYIFLFLFNIFHLFLLFVF